MRLRHFLKSPDVIFIRLITNFTANLLKLHVSAGLTKDFLQAANITKHKIL